MNGLPTGPPTSAGSASEGAPLDIRRLLEPEAYPHPVASVQLIETHISWVLLTGTYAYKIKKPVSLGFLDFSTPELRHQACLDELRLNRRFAAELYLDVVPITGTPGSPAIAGSGPVIDHAVKMVEFPQADQLDHLLESGRLDAGEMDALADHVAGFHAAAPVAQGGAAYGRPQAVCRPVRDCLDLLRKNIDARSQAAVSKLSAWVAAQETQLAPLMERRRGDGHVREVHGDLHLANLVRLESGIAAFDCIEFNASLRWIDVINDLAFTTMDLRDRGRRDLAYRLLNRYLEHTGDYDGLPLLRYYEVYRALVRAKVALIRRDGCAAGAEREAQDQHLESYLGLALELTHADTRGVVLMHGLSGSGKTAVSTALLSAMPAVRVRSDVERKRLHGLRSDQSSGSPVSGGIYSAAGSDRTYARLLQVATSILQAGEIAIVDATFLCRADRARFRQFAEDRGTGFAIASCQAPAEELERRLGERARAGHDASEADLGVLRHQLTLAEPLDAAEQRDVTVIDTGVPVDAAEVVGSLRNALARSGP